MLILKGLPAIIANIIMYKHVKLKERGLKHFGLYQPMLYRTRCTHFDSWCLEPILIRKLISHWIHMNKFTVLDRLQFYYNASKRKLLFRGLPFLEPIKDL